MSTTLDNLNVVLANVQNNKNQIVKQIEASTKALGNQTPEVVAAIDLLIATFGANVQEIGQTIGAKLQIESMQKTNLEMDALIAGLQVVLSEEALVEAADSLVKAGAPSPLSNAVGNSQPPAANDAAPSATSPVTGEEAAPGVAGSTGHEGHGTPAA